MFTWNFQFISKTRLVDTFNQLKLDLAPGEILIRIHTGVHQADEAVELAKFIKRIVPRAEIFGTSTSAAIFNGKIMPNHCVISVTQMNGGHIKTAMFPTINQNTNELLSVDQLCTRIREEVISYETKVLLTFMNVNYMNVNKFVDRCNDFFPGVQMIGGLADGANSNLDALPDNAFLFNEKGWTDKGIIVASLSGEELSAMSAYATGVEPIGNEFEVNMSLSNAILEKDNKDAAEEYSFSLAEDNIIKAEMASLFPYVYTESPDFPVFVHYVQDVSLNELVPDTVPDYKAYYLQHPELDKNKKRDVIKTNHHIPEGSKMKRSFIYDRKIIADNRAMFRKIESFEKSETIFAYSCIVRSIIYSNCIKWEISAYENSNLSGCITYGEIVFANGRNRFVSGSFVVSVMGEAQNNQEYNPYTFLYTESLADDNEELLNYLTYIEGKIESRGDESLTDAIRSFVRDCEQKILYSEKIGLPNTAAMNLDMKLRGVDRVCVIDVVDTTSMKSVFADQLIQLTYKNYVSKCENFTKSKNYHIYVLDGWQLAIGAQSFMVSLSKFRSDMEELQKQLFTNIEEYIAIVPVFAVIDNCNNDNYSTAYNSARVRMLQKNMQFSVSDAMENFLDEESIRENYHMVNVINYAIANDKVIPYYQGIYDNSKGFIHHYEALMRLEDETGKVYYPNSFLDVARNYGLLYDRISMMMVKKVFEKFKDSDDNSVSINLGMRDIRNKEMVDYIFDFLSTVKHPENFIFELLENEDIDDYNMMIEFVDRIHELGGKISIDDFGSGFSNLQHIINLQSDCVKIDGSIVKRCCENVGAENLIALISTWKTLTDGYISIIAEYVENEEIQNKLLNYDIDYSQGYLFSKPSSDIDI